MYLPGLYGIVKSRWVPLIAWRRCLEKLTALGTRNWEGGLAGGLLRWNRPHTPSWYQGRGGERKKSRRPHCLFVHQFVEKSVFRSMLTSPTLEVQVTETNHVKILILCTRLWESKMLQHSFCSLDNQSCGRHSLWCSSETSDRVSRKVVSENQLFVIDKNS